jgi:hypothetical protein
LIWRSIRPASIARVLAFLGVLRRVKKAAGLSVRKVGFAQFRDSLGVALRTLVGSRIAVVGDLAQQPFGFLPRGFRRPRRTVPAEREPTLATFPCAVEQDVSNGCAALASHSEAGERRVPDGLSRRERPHLPQSNPPFGRHRPFPLARCLLAST